MSNHAVVIAGGGPTGLMLASELALAKIDTVVVERRANQDLAGSRAGGLHARTIELMDQRGIADRFLTRGKAMQVAGFAWFPLDISDFPTRHNYGLALFQNEIELILSEWVEELGVPVLRGRDVTGFSQSDSKVNVHISDGTTIHADYLIGCDGGRSLIRKTAGIGFPGLGSNHQQPDRGSRNDRGTPARSSPGCNRHPLAGPDRERAGPGYGHRAAPGPK